MGRVITSHGVLKNVQGQIDHVTDMYDDIKDNNLKPLTVTLDSVSNANGAYSHTTEDERITEDMKPVTLEVGTPECFRATVTVSTANGSATVQCADAHGSSTITVTFVKTSPVTGGADYPPAVTSTEFDILADRIGALTDLNTTDKSSIVNAVNELESDKAPNSHASASTTYGVGNASNYGHVKLSDTYNGDPSNTAKAANSIGASQWAVQSAYEALNGKLATKVNYSDITFDAISGNSNTPTLLGGCKFGALSFDSGRTGGFTFNYTVFAFIVIGRAINAGVYLLDGFSNVITIKEGANINITCSSKTVNITVTNASYQYGFVMYC